MASLLAALELEGPVRDWAEEFPSTIERAWSHCPRGDWLLDIAAHLEIDRRTIVLSASECVLVAVSRPGVPSIAETCLATARAWLEGEASDALCRATGRAARSAYADLSTRASREADVLSAAAELTLACDLHTPAPMWARFRHAANAAGSSIESLVPWDPEAPQRTARLVRQRLSFGLVQGVIAMTLASTSPSGVRETPTPPPFPAPGRKRNGTDGA